MKITFLTVMPSPYVQDLFAALAADDRIELRVWYLEQEAPDTHWGEQAMPPYAEVLPGRWYGLSGARIHSNPGIKKRIRESDADLFVIVGYIGLTNQIAMRFLTAQNKPWAFWGEIPGLHQRKGLGNWIRRQLQKPLRSASGIAAVGSHAVAAYQKLTRDLEGRTSVFENIPYHCEIEPYQKAATSHRLSVQTQQRDDSPVRFLYCGQLIERKGVDLLLQAFTRLVQSGGSATLTLAGTGPLRKPLEDSLSEDVASRVEFLGFRPVDELPDVFAQHDVFLLPSRHDGWGVVVNQAVAAGLPVIATTAVGAANDLVIEGENGFCIAPESADSIHQAMEHFVANPDSIQKMSQQSSEVAKSVAMGQAVEDWYSFFEACLPS